MKQRYTEAEWQSHTEKLRMLPERSVLIARSRLVDGRPRKELAEAFGLSAAHITVITNAVIAAIEKPQDEDVSTGGISYGSGNPERARYTQEQWADAIANWKKHCPTGVAEGRIEPFPPKAFDIAHAALVLGLLQQEIAALSGVLQPTVQKHITAIAQALAPHLPDPLIPIMLWVKPEGIEPLKAISADVPSVGTKIENRGRSVKN